MGQQPTTNTELGYITITKRGIPREASFLTMTMTKVSSTRDCLTTNSLCLVPQANWPLHLLLSCLWSLSEGHLSLHVFIHIFPF